MRAPIGHLSAGIFIEPAEIVKASPWVEIDIGCGPEPKVPVEAGQWRFVRVIAAGRSAADTRSRPKQLADAPILHVFASSAEVFFGTLLASDLKHGAIAASGVYHRSRFTNGE